MCHYFQMMLVMEINLPAQMGNALKALGIAMAKMTVATNQMKKAVLVRKSITIYFFLIAVKICTLTYLLSNQVA